MKNITILALLIIIFSCKEENQNEPSEKENSQAKQAHIDEELKYVINDTFALGDVRRYGIMPNTGVGNHPVSQKNSIQTLLDLAEKINLDIVFPEGYYPTHLLLRGRKKINIRFDNASIGGYVQITEKEDLFSEDIKFTGKLNVYDLVLIRKSHNIQIETLNLLSDISKNTFKTRNKGVRIYGGVETLNIKDLTIDDLGSGNDVVYQKVHAAFLAVESPKDIFIDKLHIKSSDRHGVYLTGSDHIIENIIIDKFGVGNIENMSNMPDLVDRNNTKKISGVWLSRCNNSTIGRITINTNDSNGVYALRLDNGDIKMPSIIEGVKLIGGDLKPSIYAEEYTNVSVKSLEN